MYPYQNPQLSVEERVSDLLSRMSLREKIGQLTQRLYGFTSFVRQGDEVVFTDEFKDEVDYYSGLGTLYGLHRADPWSAKTFETGLDGKLSTKATNQVQKYVIEHSRWGIPVLLSTEFLNLGRVQKAIQEYGNRVQPAPDDSPRYPVVIPERPRKMSPR